MSASSMTIRSCALSRLLPEARRRGLQIPEAAKPEPEQSAPPPYLDFLRATLPRGWSADPPHIRLIAEHLDAVTRGEIDRLAIHMPPRHAKTETVTVRYPVCRMEADRRLPVLITGYNERFARRLSRKARNIAVERFGLDPAAAAQDEWALPEGGLLMARGVGSPPTGTGFGLIVIDDPVRRREDAESLLYREKTWDWYTDDLYNRLEPGGAIVVCMTLWHEDDLGARAVASEPGRWTVLKLPAIAGDADPIGRAPGAPLWPDRFDVPALTRIRDVMAQNEGLRSWEALYQQNPTPKEGAFFKVGKLGYVDAAPEGLRRCRAWDIGATAGAGDFTAGVMVSGPDAEGFWYVEHAERGQWSTEDRNERIRARAEADGRGVKIRLPQDPGAAGVDMARAMVKLLAGYSVTAQRVTGEKTTRADPFSAQVNAGMVRLVRGPWNVAYVDELRTFPAGIHDDQVDASGDGFTALATGTKPRFN